MSTPVDRISETVAVAASMYAPGSCDVLLFQQAIIGYIGLKACEIIAESGDAHLLARLRDVLGATYDEQHEDMRRMVLNVLAYTMAREFGAPGLVPESIALNAPIIPWYRVSRFDRPAPEIVDRGQLGVLHLTADRLFTFCGMALGPDARLLPEADRAVCKNCSARA